MDRLFHIFDILFQSTLPLRGATHQSNHATFYLYISIHAPLTGSDPLRPLKGQSLEISIHAPLTGSDFRLVVIRIPLLDFNPRSPYGERPNLSSSSMRAGISIHAPLTGSDSRIYCHVRGRSNFNPRSPYGERRHPAPAKPDAGDFNPRSPYGERPGSLRLFCRIKIFQSTLPLRGATNMTKHPTREEGFQSTLPLRGATCTHTGGFFRRRFQSTLPLRGATQNRNRRGSRI